MCQIWETFVKNENEKLTYVYIGLYSVVDKLVWKLAKFVSTDFERRATLLSNAAIRSRSRRKLN